MLPEKKRRLIIAIIAVLLFVIVFIIVMHFSTNAKDDYETKTKIANDEYINNYTYFGVLKDEDDVYKIYGINDTENYLNLKTFYDIKSIKNIDNRLVIYSDALNRISYDKEKDEYYFYELDSNYSKDSNIIFDKNYIVEYNDKITYRKLNSSDKTIVSENNQSKVIYDGNFIYFVEDNSIYIYSFTSLSKRFVVSEDDSIILLAASKNYIVYKYNNEYYIYDEKIDEKTKIEVEDISYINIKDNKLIMLVKDTIKEYDIEEKMILDYEYLIGEVEYINHVKNNIYFVNYKNKVDDLNTVNKSILIDIDLKETYKSFDNNYLYVGDINEV